MTIRDVARQADVSVATVSRWLAGQNIRSAEAVSAAAAQLNYRPNLAARALKTGHRGVIGVVVPDITNPFFAAIVRGLERAMAGQPYRILLANSDESTETEEEIVADLSGRVDGFVLAPAVEQDRVPLTLQHVGIPVVLLDREIQDGEPSDAVLVDNVNGARTAADHLLALGHRRIAVIGGPENTTPGRERRAGFIDALRESGVELDPKLDRTGDFREESGRVLTHDLMSLPEPPSALFVANNQMTIGALKALRQMNVTVPDDVSIVGFDDLALSSLLAVPLTCVVRADEEQGEQAMRLLLRRLGGDRSTPVQRIVLATRLEVRSSTAPVPPSSLPRVDARLAPKPDLADHLTQETQS